MKVHFWVVANWELGIGNWEEINLFLIVDFFYYGTIARSAFFNRDRS
ncbi:MAG: hypothetical protein LH628_07325 [Microcoleus sp. CAN_BIN18]|nr:hypothetical protein [Microcoleus sp. CAN_BIN18]